MNAASDGSGAAGRSWCRYDEAQLRRDIAAGYFPDGSSFLGYVVHRADRDRFLQAIRQDGGSSVTVWSDYPGDALVYAGFDEACAAALRHDADTLALVDTLQAFSYFIPPLPAPPAGRL